MLNKSTCVSTDSAPPDESLTSLRSGTSTLLNISVVMKAGSALYIATKWRDREYYGVLVDGHGSPPAHSSLKRHDSRISSSEARDSDGHHRHHRHSRGGDQPRPESRETDERPSSSSSHNKRPRAKRTTRQSDRTPQRKAREELDVDEKPCLESGETEPHASEKASPLKHATVLREFPTVEKHVDVVNATSFVRCTVKSCGFCFGSVEEMRLHSILYHDNKRGVRSVGVYTFLLSSHR